MLSTEYKPRHLFGGRDIQFLQSYEFGIMIATRNMIRVERNNLRCFWLSKEFGYGEGAVGRHRAHEMEGSTLDGARCVNCRTSIKTAFPFHFSNLCAPDWVQR